MMKKWWCVALILVATVSVKAQGIIAGKVLDKDKQPVADVSVHVMNTTITTFTDRSGEFRIADLDTGNYSIELTAIGFAAMVKKVAVGRGTYEPLVIELQNAMVQLEAVTVTADKKEELLQNVPVSVTSLSSRQVTEYRLWNAKDLTAIVPNLYAGNPGDERNVTSIRGITTTSYDPSVATYIDGVNQFSLDTYIPQLSDVERIEILRGPQGTLYGRNAMGGVINIITKKPSNKLNGFAEVNVGNYNQQRYSAGIRFPLVKNKLFIGASGLFNKRDGYYTNEFNNSSFDKQQQVAGNYYLKYLPAARWGVTLNLKHQQNRNNGAFPVVNGVDEAFSNPYKLSQNAMGRMIDNTMNISLSVSHTGKQAGFTSQTAWQQNHRYYNAPIDGDFSPLDAVTVINDYGNKWNNVKVFTQEFKFNSSAARTSRLNWTAGTYFFHQDNPTKLATHFGKDAGLLGIPATDFSSINTSTGKNTGIAFFGQLDYQLTEKLTVIGGMRYDHENRELSVRGEYQPDGQAPFDTRPDTAASLNFNALSPKVGLKYQLAANSNLFANYSRGYRPGGLTQLSSDPSQPPLFPYQPEYSNNIELGFKNTLFNNKLRVNVTAFLTYLDNAQVPTLILPDAITVTKNTGELTSKGVELELSATPIEGLQLEYNVGYVNAVYKSLKLSSNGQQVDLAGKKQIFTPDITSLLALQYSYVLSKKDQVKLVARGEWFYLGRRYFDFVNSIQQSPYSLLNTRVGVTAKKLEIFFWMRNISDRKYIEYAYDFGAVHLGSPKNYGVTLSTSF